MLKKPRLWNLSPALVAPEWRWFWESNPITLPLWEGVGTAVRDPVNKTRTDTLVGMAWAATPRGIGADNNSDGDEIDLEPDWELLGPSGSRTSFFCCIDVDSYNGTNAGIWRSLGNSNGDNFFITNAGNGLWLRAAGIDLFKLGGGLGTGIQKFAFSFIGAQEAQGYLNGVQVSDVAHSVNWDTGVGDAFIHQLGWQNSTSQRIDGRWLCAYFWEDYWLSPAQQAQLAADPFGPFRMVDETPLFVVVGGTVVNLDAILSGTTTLAAALDTFPGFAAAMSVVGAIQAGLDSQPGFDSALPGTSSILGSLDTHPGFNSIISGASTLAAELRTRLSLDAAMSVVSTIQAGLDTQPGFAASMVVAAIIAANLDTRPSFTSAISAAAIIAAALERHPSLFASIDGISSIVEELDTRPGFDTSLAAIAALLAELDGGTITDNRGILALSDSDVYNLTISDVIQYILSVSDA